VLAHTCGSAYFEVSRGRLETDDWGDNPQGVDDTPLPVGGGSSCLLRHW
jgi:hypothetical protein